VRRQRTVEQRWLRTRTGLALVDDLTDVESVAQDVEQGPLDERHTPTRAVVRELSNLCSDVAPTKFENQPVDAADREIALEDHANSFCFFFDDRELAVLKFIAQRHHPLPHRKFHPVGVRRSRRPMLSGMFDTREYVDAGGFMSYGPNIDAIYHQLARYAAKLLKRTSVGNVPAEQPTKFEMVINRRTANAIGIRLPLDLLASADQVIE
jgi:hypothetical protein